MLYANTLALALNAAIEAMKAGKGYLYDSERIAVGHLVDGANAALEGEGDTARVSFVNPEDPRVEVVAE